jgi:hypothetical protein
MRSSLLLLGSVLSVAYAMPMPPSNYFSKLQMKRQFERAVDSVILSDSSVNVDFDRMRLKRRETEPANRNQLDVTNALGPLGEVVDGVTGSTDGIADVGVDAPIIPRDGGVNVDLDRMSEREDTASTKIVWPKIIYE